MRRMEVAAEAIRSRLFWTSPAVVFIAWETSKKPEVKEEILLKVGEGITGWVAKEGKPALIRNVGEDSRYVEANPNVRSELAVPIKWGDEVVGVLNLDHYRPDAFAEEDLDLLTAFANVAAVALKNAKVLDRGGEG